ncbi:MAG: acyltransferase [Ruminococcus sp.]
MGLKIIKGKNHIKATIKKAAYKLIYGKHLRMGKGVTFRRGFTLCIEKEGRVSIGNDCFFNNYCSVNSLKEVKIGDNCIFGENVKIYDHNHKFRDKSLPIKDQGYSSSAVEIGSDCWIGSNVVILKGVKIGSHCVIGANCLIYGDIPENTVVKNNQNLALEPR